MLQCLHYIPVEDGKLHCIKKRNHKGVHIIEFWNTLFRWGNEEMIIPYETKEEWDFETTANEVSKWLISAFKQGYAPHGVKPLKYKGITYIGVILRPRNDIEKSKLTKLGDSHDQK
mgnify:CR=1 FL=1